MKTAGELHAMVEDWARELPLLAERLQPPELLEAGHRHYEAIMCATPPALQDEIYEALHVLMYHHGLCARPRWAQPLSASAARPEPQPATSSPPESGFRRR